MQLTPLLSFPEISKACREKKNSGNNKATIEVEVKFSMNRAVTYEIYDKSFSLRNLLSPAIRYSIKLKF